MTTGRAVPVGAALLVCAALLVGPAPQPARAEPAEARLELHVVRPGDTLSAIAARHRVSVTTLAAANELADPDRIRAGQVLMVPVPAHPENAPEPGLGGSARWHVVLPGDTLWDLGRHYGLPVATLIQANGLKNPNVLRPGQMLTVPQGAGTPGTAPAGRPDAGTAASPRPLGQPAVVTAGPAVRKPAFLWPAQGPVSSRFGWRWGRMHEGVDIAAPERSPIAASAAGTVRFAGWLPGYGRTVILDHGNRVETLYAHAARTDVRVGERVRAGQTIGLVGSSGFATGPHLHFEVRINGRVVDPQEWVAAGR